MGRVDNQEFSFGHTKRMFILIYESSSLWAWNSMQAHLTFLLFLFCIIFFPHKSSETQRNKQINIRWSYTLQEAHTSITTLLWSLHILIELFPRVCKTWNVSKYTSYIIVSGTQQNSLIRITKSSYLPMFIFRVINNDKTLYSTVII